VKRPIKRWPSPKRTIPIREEVSGIFAELTGVPDCWCPDEGLYSDGYNVIETSEVTCW